MRVCARLTRCELCCPLSCSLSVQLQIWRRAKVCNTFYEAEASDREGRRQRAAAVADRTVVIATSLMQPRAHTHTRTHTPAHTRAHRLANRLRLCPLAVVKAYLPFTLWLCPLLLALLLLLPLRCRRCLRCLLRCCRCCFCGCVYCCPAASLGGQSLWTELRLRLRLRLRPFNTQAQLLSTWPRTQQQQ